MSMKILGIDASTTCIGYSIWEDDKLVHFDKLRPNSKCENWMERIQDLSFKVQEIIDKYKIEKIIEENVPLIGKQNIVLVQLGSVKGMMLTISSINNISIEFIEVGTWRKNIGISCGQKDRTSMKIKSIEKVNELFNLGFEIPYTKNGNFKEDGTDDICDAILVVASVLDKYKVKKKGFGRR